MPLDVEKLIAAFREPGIVELIVNADGSVYAERDKGGLGILPFKAGNEDVLAFINALTGDVETFGPQRPYADLTALDGSRIHVIGPPLVRGGHCVTIRKRPEARMGLDAMVQGGCLTPGCAGFLKYCVEKRKNILFVGGTSSGKTSMLCALGSLIDARERILVLEDTPEIALPQPHVAHLRTRMRDTTGLPDVTLRDLLVNTLRMRPDRIIVGEVRGPEAADLLEAMNVGKEGVLCTMHANSAREALQRLETLVLLSGNNLPLKAVRTNIALAIDIVVFLARFADGVRRVAQVAEVTGMEGETITLSDLYAADTRKSGTGLAVELRPTGGVPKFYDLLRRQGVEPPMEFFKKDLPA